MATRSKQAMDLAQDEIFIHRGSHYRVLSAELTRDKAMTAVRSKDARGILTSFMLEPEERVLVVITISNDERMSWARRKRAR